MLSCCSTRQPSPEYQKPVLKETSLHRRLSLMDVSNPSSPISVDDLSNSLIGSTLYAFTLTELEVITNNFSRSHLLGEGGFGPVYKGFIDDKLRPRLKAQPVAVKVLDLDGMQGHREWLAEIVFLGQLRHPHLVKLIGYCCKEEHRLLVYEYMARGSLADQLFKIHSAVLPWRIRMKIAVEAAKGLAFLHETDKPVIYRDFKSSNILLDPNYTVKLSDFGLAQDGPEGDDPHVTTDRMGTRGYAAPEYITAGHLTTKSDVYGFGIVLLELLTGKASMEKSLCGQERSLVLWARPQLRNQKKLDRIMDPRLEGRFPFKAAQQAAALAYKCLSNRPKSRPTMSDVVTILEPLQHFDDVLPNGNAGAGDNRKEDKKETEGQSTDAKEEK